MGHGFLPECPNSTIQGEVHDEKAYYAMGGVSGHAGLFSNAEDLAKLASHDGELERLWRQAPQ